MGRAPKEPGANATCREKISKERPQQCHALQAESIIEVLGVEFHPPSTVEHGFAARVRRTPKRYTISFKDYIINREQRATRERKKPEGRRDTLYVYNSSEISNKKRMMGERLLKGGKDSFSPRLFFSLFNFE